MKNQLLISGLLLGALGLAACRATEMSIATKDPGYNPRAMRRVMVMAIVRQERNRKLMEEAFIKEFKKRDAEGVASYTLVREGEELDEAAWKKMVHDNGFDAVLVSRLIDFDVTEKDVEAKFIEGPYSTSYGYYHTGHRVVYQPGFTLREETAGVETRVFTAADEKMVWSARSKTDIEQGRDPEAQIRDFVRLVMKKIYS